MRLDWSPLRAELSKWRRKNMTLPVWWRDDDAIEVTPHLERLVTRSEAIGVPIHLAIIPRDASKELAEFIKATGLIVPVVHGWSHTDHQPDADTNSEFGEARPRDIRCEEAGEGLRRLQRMMGDGVCPMFVPPWNRVGGDMLADLPALGYRYLSTCNPRDVEEPAAGLQVINTHIDPIYWRPSRQMSHPELVIEKMTNLLKKRRQGKSDNAEPFGLLTHHLAHSPKIWEFCRQYWMELLDGPVDIFDARRAIN